MQLAGKTAFITGAGGGIGAGIAEAFAENGMKLAVADIELDRAEAEVAKIGQDALALHIDVASLESWARARDAALARFGQIDVLCNNAGVNAPRMLLDQLPPGEFARLMAINVTGVFNGVATFAPEMRARGDGHIVNTSSLNGLLPFGTMAAYSASKFAVLGLSDALREELAPFGVGVSTLFPGLTKSRMALATFGADDELNVPAEMLARMMEPVWLGRAVAKAIKDNAPYIITHPGSLPVLEQRHAAICAAFGVPAQPGYESGVRATKLR